MESRTVHSLSSFSSSSAPGTAILPAKISAAAFASEVAFDSSCALAMAIAFTKSSAWAALLSSRSTYLKRYVPKYCKDSSGSDETGVKSFRIDSIKIDS
jgi:hypothetical protein